MLKSSLLLLLALPSSLAAILSYDWNIGFVTATPDGFSRRVIGINGVWPCPTIEGTVGDTISINITNNLVNQTTGLHFHGISQRGSPEMDGAIDVTQCPVPPGSSFLYTFKLDNPGTFWYHAHKNGQYVDGLRGPLIVHDPHDPYKDKYDEEILMTTSDWYHNEVPSLIPQLLSTSNLQFAPPIPDAILINETTSFNLNLSPGKKYKIRIISMAAFASTLFQFGGHTMKIIELDGSYTEITEAEQIRVVPAQRYTVLLTTKKKGLRNSQFLASLDINRDFANTSVAAVYPHNITGGIIYNSKAKSPSRPLVVHRWDPADDVTFSALRHKHNTLLTHPNKEITLNFTFALNANGIPRALFNNNTYTPPRHPSLYTAMRSTIRNTLPQTYGPTNPFIATLNSIVQITINNNDAAIHPFHLHGHQFQVLSRPPSGTGPLLPSFSSSSSSPPSPNHDSSSMDNFLGTPMQRDTLSVNANSHAVIRFKAGNPGVWLFHCHIEWHVVMGLVATIVEAPEVLRGGIRRGEVPRGHFEVCEKGRGWRGRGRWNGTVGGRGGR